VTFKQLFSWRERVFEIKAHLRVAGFSTEDGLTFTGATHGEVDRACHPLDGIGCCLSLTAGTLDRASHASLSATSAAAPAA